MAHWRQRLERRRRMYTHTHSSSLTWKMRLAMLSKYAFLGVLLTFVGMFVIFPILAFILPSPDKIVRTEGFSTKILDRNGKVLYDIFEGQKRTYVPFNEIPDYIKQATISIEDKDFYKHQGFDVTGMIRGFSRLFTRGRAQGGSTLTQQLVKNVFYSSDRSIIRKVKELVLAIQIEAKYKKDQILEMYLNEIPYGGTAVGVESAAETYFGKKARDLTLVESAILAGLPQRPSYYSPYSSSPKAYIARTHEVLRRMREDGNITKEQEEAARAELENVEFEPKGANFKAPHFVQYVQKILEDRYGQEVIERGGLRVTTTLDLDLQDKAQQIVSEEIAKVEKQKITNGASVVLNSDTGEILAMVGSKDFGAQDYDGQVNVTLSLRQPGSAIKPITYVTGFKKGYTPATLFMDVPTKFPGGAGQPDYEPGNYDGKFRGPIQLRYALGNSINIPAVKMLALVGVKDTLQTAYDMGLTSLEPTKDTLSRVGLSLTLGGGEIRLLELTGAYSVFMNEGFRVDPVAILKVEDRDGKVLEKVEPKKGKRVLEEGHAFLMANVLSDNTARLEVFGANSLLNVPGREIAVKTGTTNDKRDNWTIGGNPQVTVGVWVGNNDNSPMLSVASGVSGASPIWRKTLLAALEGKPVVTFKVPDSVVKVDVDSISGYRAHDGFASRSEYFLKGTEPQEDPVHVKLKVCRGEGKLATPSDVAANNFDEKEFLIFKEEDPTAGSGQVNRWQEGILSWLSTQTDGKYKPPTEFCGTSAPINVEFVHPKDRTSNLPNQFTVKVVVDATSNISQVELEIDGQKVRTFAGEPYEYEVTLSDGVHNLRAKARDEKGNESDRRVTVGVNKSWDYSPTPSPTPIVSIP